MKALFRRVLILLILSLLWVNTVYANAITSAKSQEGDIVALGPQLAQPAQCGGLAQEAEDGFISGKFEISADAAASGGQYVYVPDGAGDKRKIGQGNHQVTYCFNLTAAGDYQLIGWAHAANSGSNSFFVQIDDAPGKGYLWHVPENTTYQPAYVTHKSPDNRVIINLNPGQHTVTFYLREDGTRLDRLALELIGGPAPTNTPEPTATPAPAPEPSDTPPPTPVPTNPPGDENPSPYILWSTDHESGDFTEWEVGQGQAIFNSNTSPGTSEASISSDVAHSGAYSLKMSLTGAENAQSQGARVFRRWLDGEAGIPLPDEAYYSAWYYFPQTYQPVAWWNIFQFKSRGENSNPMFSFNIFTSDTGEMSLYIWDKANGGQAHGQLGEAIPIPVGQWVHIEAYLKKRYDPTGALIVWQDGVKIIEAQNIRTILNPDDRLHWSVNNYTDDIRPANPVIYVDDAAISTQRLGPN